MPWAQGQGRHLSRSSSKHLHNTLHLNLDLTGWALWREWQVQNPLSNFLTTRRSASSTTERNARLRNTWIKFKPSAFVHHGLFRLTRAKIRWKHIFQTILIKNRWSPYVDQRRRVVLQTKLWKTKAVWFLVLVSMLILRTITWASSWSKQCKQIWWQVQYLCVLNIWPNILGFDILTQEIGHSGSGSKERLRQMFSTSTEEEEDGVKSFRESYHKYKREYVKHLSFNPEEENLSKCILNGKSYERKKQTFI